MSASKSLRTFDVKKSWGTQRPEASPGPALDRKRETEVLMPSGPAAKADLRFHGPSSSVIPTEQVDHIRRVLGISFVEDERKLRAVAFAMDAIREQSAKVLEGSVQIGREMNALMDRISDEEGVKVLRCAKDLFPMFSPSVLSRMMGAARFFDSGLVSSDILPGSYTVLYQLSKLPKPVILRAVERHIIRPDLSRRDAAQIPSVIDSVAVEEDAATSDSDAAGTVHPDVASARREVKDLVSRLSTARSRLRRLEARHGKPSSRAAGG